MNIICLDTETTGTKKGYDEILQLSIISGDGSVLFSEHFKPVNRYTWNEAEDIHHISPYDVKDCKPLLYYKNTIQNLLRSADVIVGYNIVGFDLPMLFICGIENDVKSGCVVCDIMLSFSSVYGEWNYHFSDYKYQKLSKCAEYYHYPCTEWHDALDDAKATLFCFYAMYGNPPVIPSSGIGIIQSDDVISSSPEEHAPKNTSNKKTGRVMIAFGIFFAVGSVASLQFGGLFISAPLLYFGIRRYKAFKRCV